MSQAQISDPTENVLQELAAALSSDQVPREAKLHGSRLLDRLQAPVQVVVMGKPQSGKSRLINMLLGQPVYPRIADLPAFEVVHGDRERTLIVHEDERVEDWRGGAGDPLPADTAMVRVELPLPILRRLALTEVTLSGPTDAQRAAAAWAMDRADIAIWCTQSFDAIERSLWAPAPDRLKDHSFLVITKADQLLMKGQLQGRLAELEDIVAQEFHSLYSVATIQAISAREKASDPDGGGWTASGGRALHDAVLRLVETGRRADADNALLFLSRYSAIIAQAARRPEPAREKAPTEAQRPAPVARVALDAPGLVGMSTRNRQIFSEALDYLQERADRMITAMEAAGGNSQGMILDHCLETANTLSELLADFDSSDPALSALQDDVLESADMMLLLRLEQTEDAAADAVTLLMQLKKEVAEKTVG
ncbi:MAG: hypothetical protein EP307_09880 [Rhodobacteraceae bacterium]|nr:MAG: hypothetical protein EP307_09880 [Paracoccaceae bacterium]